MHITKSISRRHPNLPRARPPASATRNRASGAAGVATLLALLTITAPVVEFEGRPVSALTDAAAQVAVRIRVGARCKAIGRAGGLEGGALHVFLVDQLGRDSEGLIHHVACHGRGLQEVEPVAVGESV